MTGRPSTVFSSCGASPSSACRARSGLQPDAVEGVPRARLRPHSGESQRRRNRFPAAAASISAIDPPPEGVMLLTPATQSLAATRDALQCGVKAIWFYRAAGRGAVSPEAVQLAATPVARWSPASARSCSSIRISSRIPGTAASRPCSAPCRNRHSIAATRMCYRAATATGVSEPRAV